MKDFDWCQRVLAKHGMKAVTHRGAHPYSLPDRGYVVADVETNWVVAGNHPVDFCFNLADLVVYVEELTTSS